MGDMLEELKIHPVTPDRWQEFEALFGRHVEAGGCSCMWWRIKRREFEANRHEGNRTAMKDVVDSGKVPGLLAYNRGVPIGWVSVAPREDFPVLGRSRVLKPVDDLQVWSVVCFVVRQDYKRQGMSGSLLQAAVEYASNQGATIVEGYPIDPMDSAETDIYSFTGFLSTFKAAGFVEVVRRSERKPIMRLYL